MLAVVVGVMPPVVMFGWAALVAMVVFDPSLCGEYTGCLGLFVWDWDVGRWGAVVLAWPLLYLVRVRPAWRVAIVGGVFLAAIWRFAATEVVAVDGAVMLAVCGGLIAYPVAAWVTTPGVHRLVRVLVVGLFVGLFVYGALAGG